MTFSGPLPAQRIARWIFTVIDGAHPWGSIHSSVDRRGTTSFVLVVFPPGLSAAGRRRVRLWRAWPGIGLLLLMPTLVVGHLMGSVRVAFAVAIMCYLALGFAAFRAASPGRAQVRELWTTDSPEEGKAGELRLVLLERLVDALAQAEIARERGLWGADEFRRTWAEVYDELDPARQLAWRRPARDSLA